MVARSLTSAGARGWVRVIHCRLSRLVRWGLWGCGSASWGLNSSGWVGGLSGRMERGRGGGEGSGLSRHRDLPGFALFSFFLSFFSPRSPPTVAAPLLNVAVSSPSSLAFRRTQPTADGSRRGQVHPGIAALAGVGPHPPRALLPVSTFGPAPSSRGLAAFQGGARSRTYEPLDVFGEGEGE